MGDRVIEREEFKKPAPDQVVEGFRQHCLSQAAGKAANSLLWAKEPYVGLTGRRYIQDMSMGKCRE